MCGIIAVVRRRSSRTPPTPAELQGWLDAASLALDTEGWPGVAGLRAAADAIEAMDQALRGVPGVRALIDAPDAVGAIRHGMTAFESRVAELDRRLDAGEVDFPDSEVEAVNAGIVRLKDACWAVLRDRFRTHGWSDAVLRYFEDRRGDHSERAWARRARMMLEFLFPPS